MSCQLGWAQIIYELTKHVVDAKTIEICLKLKRKTHAQMRSCRLMTKSILNTNTYVTVKINDTVECLYSASETTSEKVYCDSMQSGIVFGNDIY